MHFDTETYDATARFLEGRAGLDIVAINRVSTMSLASRYGARDYAMSASAVLRAITLCSPDLLRMAQSIRYAGSLPAAIRAELTRMEFGFDECASMMQCRGTSGKRAADILRHWASFIRAALELTGTAPEPVHPLDADPSDDSF